MTATISPESGDTETAGPSDADLLAAVRAGDRDAYGELYRRHEPAATNLARYLTRTPHEADDVVADAFARVLRAIDGGAGPTEAFRPYLLTAVRRTVWRRAEQAEASGRLAVDDDEAELLDLRLAVDAPDRTDEAIILEAFKGLPERWQLVLWHTEIEGQPPAEVAPLLGLSPNATAALAVRAREGLRQAYLQAHLQARPADSCRFSVEHLGSFVRDGLGKRDNAKVEAHPSGCGDCQALQSDLGSLNKALRSVVGPAVLGAAAARYLADAGRSAPAATGGSGAELDGARGVVHRLRFPQAVGLAGVAAALLVTLGVRSDLARPPVADPASTEVAAAVPAASTRELVEPGLSGSPAATTPGVQWAACTGVGQPLSLPGGATIVGARLVRAPDASGDPSDIDPATAEDLETVPSGDTALVGAGDLCVSDLIQPLADAPDDTAVTVSWLDRLGRLHVLLVPQVVEVVRDAVRSVADLAESLDARLRAWLLGIQVAADAAAAGLDPALGELTGTVDDLAGGALPSGGVPDAPALPPAPTGNPGGIDSVVGDTVSGVGDVVNGLLPGVDLGPGGLLG